MLILTLYMPLDAQTLNPNYEKDERWSRFGSKLSHGF
jgi:hypothetical protein